MSKVQKKKKIKKIVKVFSISLIFVILVCVTVFFSIFFSVKLDDSSISKASAKINIYDKENTLISLPPKLRAYVEYEKISPNIVNAFVALEDKRFYKHSGIDFVRMGGAFYNNIKAGYVKEGGSTISQQLAKNTQLNSEKSLKRKIKEAKLALDIENRYSKNQIMEMYLNAIYFGSGIYGINDACKRFFDKEPMDIEVYEAAILAGVVKNPAKNSPLVSPENANQRKNLVLKIMKEQQKIDDSVYLMNIEKSYTPHKESITRDINSPFISAVISQAAFILNKSEKEIIQSGYHIYTYYDKDIQNTIYKAYESGEFSPKNSNNLTPDSLTLITDNHSGGVSGYFANHNISPYKLKRQPSSAIKPIMVYAPAFEKNHITSASIYKDIQTKFGQYQPKNYMNSYKGHISIREAIKNSSNVVAVKILDEIGVNFAKSYASNMGIKFSPQDKYLSLALGGMTEGLSPVELTEAYMTLANGGKHTDCEFIREITDQNGNVLYRHKPRFTDAISPQTAFLVTDLLKDTAKEGTAKKLRNLQLDVASKTGTVGGSGVQNNDAWNLSYTTDNTMCVWYGNINYDKNKAFDITGGTYPTMMARYIYQNLDSRPSEFAKPKGIVKVKIDTLALKEFNKIMIASENTPEKHYEYEFFNIRNAPKELSPLFIMPKTNLFVEFNDDFLPKISFDTKPEYNYKLIRKNLLTGDEQTVHTVTKSSGIFTYDDKSVSDFGLISYRVEVENKYSKIGQSKEKFIFINELLSVNKTYKQ